MTRYQTAVSTFYIWLAKARAPIQDAGTREAVERVQLERLPRLVRLWRTIGGGGRHGVDSHD